MGQTLSATKNGFIQRLAAAWIQEIGLHGFTGHPETLFEHPELVRRIKKLSPATLGIIGWQGQEFAHANLRTSLYEVCQGVGVKYEGGKELLRRLARAAMAAEIFDQLGQPREDRRTRTNSAAMEEYSDMLESDRPNIWLEGPF
jgi:hypothetical protein